MSSDEAGQRNAGNDQRVLEVKLVKKGHEMSDGRQLEVKKMKVSDSRHGYVTS